MKLIKPSLLIIVLLLSLAFLLSRGGTRQTAEEAAAVTVSQPEAVTERRAEAELLRAAIDRARPQQASALQPTPELLDSLGVTLQEEAMTALQAEVGGRFADFLASLEGSPQRIEEIRQALIAAYGDILAFGVALERGEITASEANARTDPNYVVSQMAELLNPAELTALETFLETEARERFQSTYGPQLEVIGVELTADNNERLLETLFLETYLAVNENGLGSASNLEASLQRQLDAIENTRNSLRLSMTPEQFAEAEKFLGEQELGLLGAQTIFSAN